MEENHHAGTQCRCWKKKSSSHPNGSSKFSAQNFPWPSFFTRKASPIHKEKPTPLPNLRKIFKGSLFRYSFQRDDTKKLGQITTPTAMRVTGSCGASDKTNQMTRPKQPIFVRSKWDVPKGLSDPVFVGFFSPLISKMSACIFSTPTTMGRFSGK